MKILRLLAGAWLATSTIVIATEGASAQSFPGQNVTITNSFAGKVNSVNIYSDYATTVGGYPSIYTDTIFSCVGASCGIFFETITASYNPLDPGERFTDGNFSGDLYLPTINMDFTGRCGFSGGSTVSAQCSGNEHGFSQFNDGRGYTFSETGYRYFDAQGPGSAGLAGAPLDYFVSVSVSPGAIPEVSTWVMMLLGMAGLTGLNYVRRRNPEAGVMVLA